MLYKKSNCRQQSHHVRDKCLNIVAVEEKKILMDLVEKSFKRNILFPYKIFRVSY